MKDVPLCFLKQKMHKEQTLEAPTKPGLPKLIALSALIARIYRPKMPLPRSTQACDTVSSNAAQKMTVQRWVPGVELKVPAAQGSIWSSELF